MTQPSTDYRLVTPKGLVATRATLPLHAPKPTSIAALAGLRYERRVHKQLQRHLALGHFLKLEHNPWFTFSDFFGASSCCPDFLLWPLDGSVVIVEVKLTWTPVALNKLIDLYHPVVHCALGTSTQSLIIVRNLIPEAPPAKHSLSEALASPSRILQYFDNGPMLW